MQIDKPIFSIKEFDNSTIYELIAALEGKKYRCATDAINHLMPPTGSKERYTPLDIHYIRKYAYDFTMLPKSCEPSVVADLLKQITGERWVAEGVHNPAKGCTEVFLRNIGATTKDQLIEYAERRFDSYGKISD